MGPQVPRLGDRRLAKPQMGGHVPPQGVGRRTQERAFHQPAAASLMSLVDSGKD